MVTTAVKPQSLSNNTRTMSNNTRTMSNNTNVNTKNTNVKTKNSNRKNKKVNKINAKTAIPFKNLRGSPIMLKKQPQNAIYNVNIKSKSRSNSISGGFDLSPLISAILLAGIKLSLNKNNKLVDKSKSTKSIKSPKTTKSK